MSSSSSLSHEDRPSSINFSMSAVFDDKESIINEQSSHGLLPAHVRAAAARDVSVIKNITHTNL
jgi:hypothetical protein